MQLLDFEHWEGKSLRPSEVKRYRRVFDLLMEYFINTPVMGPEGYLYIIEGMIKSGSGFTQLIGSIITALIMSMLAVHTGNGIYDLKVLGDDGYTALAQFPDIKKWADLIWRWFRMVLSVDKTKVFSGNKYEKEFIGYVFKGGFLVRSSFELFNLLLHPSSKVDSLQKSFSRLTAYMFVGGVSDIKFCKFYEFFQSCYPLDSSWDYLEDYEGRRKRDYAGQEIPVKKLLEYTMHDFLYALVSIK